MALFHSRLQQNAEKIKGVGLIERDRLLLKAYVGRTIALTK